MYSKLKEEYLKLLEQNFNYEINQLLYRLKFVQNNPVVTELFIKLKYLKPKRVVIYEIPIEEKDTFLNNIQDIKVELKVHPCATMIEEALVQGFDDYFDKTDFIEPCQEKSFGFMFKIKDRREYDWNHYYYPYYDYFDIIINQ